MAEPTSAEPTSDLKDIIERIVDRQWLPMRAATSADEHYRFRYSSTGVPRFIGVDEEDELVGATMTVSPAPVPASQTPWPAPATDDSQTSDPAAPLPEILTITQLLRLAHLPALLDEGRPWFLDLRSFLLALGNTVLDRDQGRPIEQLFELLVEQGLLTTTPRWSSVAAGVRRYRDCVLESLETEAKRSASPHPADENSTAVHKREFGIGRVNSQYLVEESAAYGELKRFCRMVERRASLLLNALLLASAAGLAAVDRESRRAMRMELGLRAMAKWDPKGSRREDLRTLSLLKVLWQVPVLQPQEQNPERADGLRQRVESLQGFDWVKRGDDAAELLSLLLSSPPEQFSGALAGCVSVVLRALFNTLLSPAPDRPQRRSVPPRPGWSCPPGEALPSRKLPDNPAVRAACLWCEVAGTTVVSYLRSDLNAVPVLGRTRVWLASLQSARPSVSGPAACPRWLGLLALHSLGVAAAAVLRIDQWLPASDSPDQVTQERDQAVRKFLEDQTGAGSVSPPSVPTQPVSIAVILAAPQRLQTGLAMFLPASTSGCLCVPRNELAEFVSTLSRLVPLVEVGRLFVEEPSGDETADSLRQPFFDAGLTARVVPVVAVYPEPPASARFDRIVPMPVTLDSLLAID